MNLEYGIKRMIASLRHRGPDDDGIWLDQRDCVALGHTRLAVLDLTPAGHQPMVSTSGRFALVFNGEIYNHCSLRAELQLPTDQSSGARNKLDTWRGHSDTETLLAGFERWGIPETIKRTVGMFALAVWDRISQTLTLARDRLGEKPLYYGWQGEYFLFGSELKALKANPVFNAPVDRNSLALFLRHSYVPAPYSIYQGIHKLLPGTCLQVRSREDMEVLCYWSPREKAEVGQSTAHLISEREAVDELDKLVRQSLAGQIVADVPLGAFLSGGIDSSSIVALMQQLTERPVKTFTIGFHEDSHNEAAYALAIAQYLRTDHTELYVTAPQALSIIPDLPKIYDEPFADSSQIPTYLVSKLARQHVTVCLSGDGGDELFGGYNRYTWASDIWRYVHWLPYPLRAALGSFLGTMSGDVWRGAVRGLVRFLPTRYRYSEPEIKLQKIGEILAVRGPEEIYRELVSYWKQPSKVVQMALEPDTVLTDKDRWVRLPEFEHRMMYLDMMSYLPDDILVKVDRAAMAVSLETRVPFLDHRLVEFAWHLPLKYKIRNGVGKWVLRQLLDRYVPRDLIDRPKMGFGVPIGAWLRGPLRSWAEHLLEPKRLTRQNYLNPTPITQMWKEHLSGHDRHYFLWNVLMFQSWLHYYHHE